MVISVHGDDSGAKAAQRVEPSGLTCLLGDCRQEPSHEHIGSVHAKDVSIEAVDPALPIHYPMLTV